MIAIFMPSTVVGGAMIAIFMPSTVVGGAMIAIFVPSTAVGGAMIAIFGPPTVGRFYSCALSEVPFPNVGVSCVPLHCQP